MGIRSYDATRGFLKQIGGDNTAQLFDKFLGGLDLFLFLTLGATLKIGFDKLKRSIGDTARRSLVGGASGAGACRRRRPSSTGEEKHDRIFWTHELDIENST